MLWDDYCIWEGGMYRHRGNRARAKIDCRLVTDMSPEDMEAKLRGHLDRHGFNDIKITRMSGGRPYRVSLEAPECL